ncbi:hypothetical protein N8344_01015 [bacterium]|nr:hypothetical protein [bacterium]
MDIFNLNGTPAFDFMRSDVTPHKYFLGSVEQQHYNNINKVMSSKYWKYANLDKVTYQNNSDGFRSDKELSEIDWKNTSVVIGCSYVYGQACENDNTVSEILTREYGVPFFNGGICGASNRITHNNAIAFMRKYNPKKVIIIWSYPTRNTWVNCSGSNKKWEHQTILPMGIDKVYKKTKIRDEKIPPEFFDGYCLNTVNEWKLAIEIQTMLGNKQYYTIDKYINEYDDANWIKPKDMRLYEMKLDLQRGNTKFTLEDLQKPEPYELINSLYARDLHWHPKQQRVELGHFGEQMNRDIADLIYRENFT